MLADAAQVAEGKLYILGGGWNIISVGAPSAIAIRVGVPAMTGVGHYRWKLVLNDEDGRAVTVPTAAQGFAPLELGGEFEIPHPPGVWAGPTLWQLMAINLGPLPLQEGQRYVWRLFVNDLTSEHWQLPFSVRGAAG